MERALQTIYLARHAETAWSQSGQHTGLTDLPLTEKGEREALRLGDRLARLKVATVLTSPLQRARRTCELARFGATARVDHDLVEWDYGKYEGKTTAEIRAENPNWELFRDGCPGGETVEQVSARANRVIERLRATPEDVLVFSSAHFIRALAARWLGMEIAMLGGRLLLGTTSLSALSYEHDTAHPALKLWNETC